ncbi:hypothetical protein LEP1GSC081_3119 [Leptospira kirschneri str. H1]|uniref:Uncharacterized protein n=1 Tax=Leptospira kirschneri str. H1 TaxID=1049966 RepID=A0A0E2AZ35_9LEPT|nr:hypothetical protein LEP1GSC081_3119 [Leptospira kirschneri str. H1]
MVVRPPTKFQSTSFLNKGRNCCYVGSKYGDRSFNPLPS